MAHILDTVSGGTLDGSTIIHHYLTDGSIVTIDETITAKGNVSRKVYLQQWEGDKQHRISYKAFQTMLF